MRNFTGEWFEIVMDRWLNAGPQDYAHLILAVIVLGWFVGKMNSKHVNSH